MKKLIQEFRDLGMKEFENMIDRTTAIPQHLFL
jgi:hypothetical protein